MRLFGTKAEHFVKIAAKNHKHSLNNPYSQFQKGFTADQIRNSTQIHGVLTKMQCCPTSDGAGAAIVCNQATMKALGLEDQAVEIVAMELTTDTPNMFKNSRQLVGYSMTKAAAEQGSSFIMFQSIKRLESQQNKLEWLNFMTVFQQINQLPMKVSNYAMKAKPDNSSIRAIIPMEVELQ